jgi:hypothetical protein
MPARTHWREREPSTDIASTWVEHRIPQAKRAPSGDRPDVTTRAWIRWAEQQIREERARAALAVAEEPVRPPATSQPPAAPVGPADDRPRRTTRPSVRLSGAAVALVLLLAAATWWWLGQPDEQPNDQARSLAAGSRTVPAPESPVALPPAGTHLLVRVLDSGDLEVEQWVRRDGGSELVELAPPEGVRVRDLTLVAGSRRLEAPKLLAGPTEIAAPSGARLYLRYRLSGALELGDDDRALARATSVTFGEQPASQTVDFVGATVLSLACTPLIGDALPVPCGADAGVKGWRVVRPAGVGAVQVMAQLDLTLG